MSNLLKIHHDGGWCAVPNAVLEEPKLSWRAKALWAYLYSRPDGWEVREGDLVARSTDGRFKVRSSLEELEASGYLTRTQVRQRGQFSTTTYELHLPDAKPSTTEPSTVEPTTVEPTTVDQTPNKKEESNTEKRKTHQVYAGHFAHWLTLYPERDEPAPRVACLRSYIKARESGASEQQLIDAAANYRHWCKANDRLGTRYVYSAVSFLNTHWPEWVDRKPVESTVRAANGLVYIR